MFRNRAKPIAFCVAVLLMMGAAVALAAQPSPNSSDPQGAAPAASASPESTATPSTHRTRTRHRDHTGATTRDDSGRRGEAEPGDDRGGGGEAEPGDDRGVHFEPGDDHGGGRNRGHGGGGHDD
jgi:hypothetical protein